MSQEKPTTQEETLEKRKGEICLGCQQPEKVAVLSLNNQPLLWQDGHLEFYKERLRRFVQESRQGACNHGWELV